MTYKITEWQERYEVNSKGQPARAGDELRAKSLEYIRQKVNGRRQGAGYRRLISIAGREKAMEVFGIFLKCLEIAGDAKRGERGILPSIKELSFLIDVPDSQVVNAIDVMIKLNWISEIAGNSVKIPATYITKPNPTEHNITKQNNNIPGKPEEENNQTQNIPIEKIGVVNFSQSLLELDLLITQKRNECMKKLSELFTFNHNEAITFANIMKYLSLKCQTREFKPEIFNDIIRWAKTAKATTASNKKGLLVQKIKTETGYTGNGLLLTQKSKR